MSASIRRRGRKPQETRGCFIPHSPRQRTDDTWIIRQPLLSSARPIWRRSASCRDPAPSFLPFYFGGTSVLIVVRWRWTHTRCKELLAHQYEWLIETSQLRVTHRKRKPRRAPSAAKRPKGLTRGTTVFDDQYHSVGPPGAARERSPQAVRGSRLVQLSTCDMLRAARSSGTEMASAGPTSWTAATFHR